MAGKKTLSPKQARFIEQYLIDLNATQAAVRAGYSQRTAGQQGEQLLKKLEIQEAVAAAMKARSRRTEITADRVLRELARVAFFDVRRTFNAYGSLKPLSEMDAATAASIASFETVELGCDTGGIVRKVRLADKIRALELLGKHLGLFSDRIKMSGDDENPLTLLIRQVQGASIGPVRLPSVRREDGKQAA